MVLLEAPIGVLTVKKFIIELPSGRENLRLFICNMTMGNKDKTRLDTVANAPLEGFAIQTSLIKERCRFTGKVVERTQFTHYPLLLCHNTSMVIDDLDVPLDIDINEIAIRARFKRGVKKNCRAKKIGKMFNQDGVEWITATAEHVKGYDSLTKEEIDKLRLYYNARKYSWVPRPDRAEKLHMCGKFFINSEFLYPVEIPLGRKTVEKKVKDQLTFLI